MGRWLLILLLLLVYGTKPAGAQSVDYSLAGSTYAQSFNNLPGSGSFTLTGKGPFDLSASPFNIPECKGWQLWMARGSNANAGFAVGTGSSTGNGVYSLGTAGSSERALGSLSSSTGIYSFGLLLTNTTGHLLTRFILSFTTEQWRKGGSENTNTWTFSYKTGSFSNIAQTGTIAIPELNMQSVITTTPAGSLNGNLAENRKTVSFTVDNITWQPGEQLLLRWDDADETGSDDVCALDDISFQAELISSAPSVAVLPAQSVTTVSATLSGSVDEHFATTIAKFIIDTDLLFNSPDTLIASPDTLLPGSGNTAISANALHLQTNIVYHYFLLATNQQGTTRSDTLSFTTQASIPSVNTSSPRILTTATAEVGGNILSTGGLSLTQKGIIWSFTSVIDASCETLVIDDTAHLFNDTLSALPRGVIIYLWAYASNAEGTGYGPLQSFMIPPDTVRPSVIYIDLPGNKTYITGDSLLFCFHFSEPVVVQGITASFTFPMTLGSRTKTVSYVSGNGTDSLLFRYIIQPGESDKDGIRINSPVVFNNVEIKDSSGNIAITTYHFPSLSGIIVDAAAPAITGVKTPVPGNYLTGNLLDFIVSYSRKVWLLSADSSCWLTVIIGNNTRKADYIGGSGSNALLFRYSIQREDMDKDGIKLAPFLPGNALLRDEPGNTAELQLSNIGALSKILVNPPSVAIMQVSVPDNGWYRQGDTLFFSVNTSEPVWVNTANGIPSLKFTAGSSQKQAFYTGGSGTTGLFFQYPVQAGDLDTNGIVLNSTLAFNNGTISDARGNMLPASLNPIPNTSAVFLDAIKPGVKTVLTPGKYLYRIGDSLFYHIIFNERILIHPFADTPWLGLQVGAVKRKAMYHRFDGSNTLQFVYTVVKNDLDKNGVFADTLLNLDPSFITDVAGNECNPVLKNIASQSGTRIDAVAPVFIHSTDSIDVCRNGAAQIQALLQASDEEDNETINWSLSSSLNGSVSEISIDASSNGDTIEPHKIVYTPTPGFAGIDSVLVDITDGLYRSQKRIFIHVLPSIQNNQIGPSQMICANNMAAALEGQLPAGGNGRYQFLWESSGNDSSGFSKAPGINTTAFFSPGKLSSDTWYRRKVFSGPCETVSIPVVVKVAKNGMWTGKYDSRWHNPNNWCNNIVPDSTTDVLINIQSQNPPVISEPAICRNITLDDHTRLSINSSLSLLGTINSDSGAIDLGSGTLTLAGKTKQVLPAFVFAHGVIRNLTISNPSGVEIKDSLSLLNKLVLRNKSVLFTNDRLLLRDNAFIGSSDEQSIIHGMVSFVKPFRVQNNAWQWLGHPFTHSIGLSMISDSIDIFGNNGALNGFSPSPANTPSAFYYDHRTGNDSLGLDNGWIAFTDTKPSQGNEWNAFAGMRLLATTKNGQPLQTDSVTLFFKGAVHTGQQEIRLPGTRGGNYHVLSNPYPAPVDLSKLSTGLSISSCFWQWDRGMGTHGGYTCMPFGTPRILPAFGTFIVSSTDSINNGLLFTEQMKTGIFVDTGLPVASFSEPFVELRLYNDHVLYDRLLFWGADTAWQGIDRLDGEKIPNPEVNFYSLSRERKKLSVDARRFYSDQFIPLGITTRQPGKFTIQFSALRLPSDYHWQLHDRYLKKWKALEKDSSYHFETTTDTASFGEYRFEIGAFYKEPDTAATTRLIIQLSPVPATHFLKIQFSTWDKGNTTVRLFSQEGSQVKQQQFGFINQGELQLPVAALQPGMYFLELRCGEQVVTRKFLKQ